MPQQQRILPVVGGVAQPPLAARFARARLVPAIEDHAFVGASACRHRPDCWARQRWRGFEKPFRLVQPPVLSVELDRCADFGVDPLERMRVADGPKHPEAEQDNLVAEHLRGKRESGSRNRKLIGLMVEIVPP